jgi:multicomponent Na+:H+ antiporter subunit F
MPELYPFFLGAAVALTFFALLYIYRVIVGPTVFDRLVGVAGIGTKVILLLILIGVLYDRLDMVIDIVLGYALLNFVATLAAARYFTGTPVGNGSDFAGDSGINPGVGFAGDGAGDCHLDPHPDVDDRLRRGRS